MVKNLFLVMLIVAGATASLPPLRERAAPRVGPAFEEVVGWWMVRLQPILDPVFRWSAKNELRRIVRDLKERHETFRAMPDPARFDEYVRANLQGGRDGRDPWGVPYFYNLTTDSIMVGSAGPDMTRGTEDDILVSLPRR